MKYLFKKYWYVLLIALVINIPILVVGTIRTDKSLILKGDTTYVENFVEIENAYQSDGSFSTIYVISFDHSTILQNWLLQNDNTADVSNMSDAYLHFTDSEMSEMGKIQHSSSIQYALITSYLAASKINSSIHLDYHFNSFVVSYYSSGSDFRINDRIVGINGIMAKDSYEDFRSAFNNQKKGDVLHILRGSRSFTIELDDKNYKSIGGYAYYDINSETASPKFSLKSSNVGGPSGGLLQTLALYNALVETDITKSYKIAGTGTISIDGTVGPIGGIQQKIYTAFDDKIEIFLCPSENYEEALIAYNRIPNKEKMKLFSVETFEEALEVLANV